jgi:hypothetical protein
MSVTTNASTKDTTDPTITAVEAYWDAQPCNIRHLVTHHCAVL